MRDVAVLFEVFDESFADLSGFHTVKYTPDCERAALVDLLIGYGRVTAPLFPDYPGCRLIRAAGNLARPYGVVFTLMYAHTPLPLAFVAKRRQLYGQLALNPETVMGLAAPDAVAAGDGPSGSHATV